MTAPVFLVPAEQLAGAAAGGVLELGGAEGRHAADVRRIRAGEEVDLVDGLGARARGTVEQSGRGTLWIAVQRVEREPVPPVRVAVALALVKGDRFDDAVTMLTELGVDEILPWSASRSVVQWRGEKMERALQRLAAIAAAAGKQSRRARFPTVAPLLDTAALAGRAAAADAALVLHESADRPLPAAVLPSSGEVLLVIGPEGGIAEDELRLLRDSGAGVVRAGPTVLRSATAAAAAAAVVLTGCGRWG